MLERRANPIGRAATANVPRISLGGMRLAVLDVEQTANFMIDMVFPRRRVGRPLYLTSANGEVLARCSIEPMTGRLFRAADRKLLDAADGLVAMLPVELDINDAMEDVIAALGGAERKLIGVVINELHTSADTSHRSQQYA